MLKPIVYPYKMGSTSAKLLSSALGCRRVFPDRNYRPRENHLIINWGSSKVPSWTFLREWGSFLNEPSFVSTASNKLETFRFFLDSEINHPPTTTLIESAKNWVQDGYKVVCRTILNGHSGQGIVVASTIEELVDSPLYTQLVPKDKEFRVHVFQGHVIDFAQKKKRLGAGDTIPHIRSHENGWVFCRENVELPEEVEHEAIKSVTALGLDFGAVDVATKREGGVVVFEVNTAPGICGSTLDKYVNAIRRLL